MTSLSVSSVYFLLLVEVFLSSVSILSAHVWCDAGLRFSRGRAQALRSFSTVPRAIFDGPDVYAAGGIFRGARAPGSTRVSRRKFQNLIKFSAVFRQGEKVRKCARFF